MGKISRRDVLKQGSALLVAGSLTACAEGDSSASAKVGASKAEFSDASHQAYDSGTVPLASSGWTKTLGEGPDYPSLSEDLSCDVLIVGAGLAGCSLALHLAELGVDTVVVEARQPGWGASGRNAGHVLPLLRDVKLFEQFPDKGEAFFKLFQEHHTIPFDIAAKYNIDCDATQSGYLNAMSSQKAFDKFARSAARPAERLGQSIKHLDAAQMRDMTGSDYYPYGVLYESGGRVNPYLLSSGMAAAAQGLGARIFGDSAAKKLSPEGSGWKVQVEQGATVRCDKVIFCTNAYATDIVPAFKQSCYPMTAYALCTEPLPDELYDIIMPSRATLAQVPIDLNPLVVDAHKRIVTASMPSRRRPADAQWHFEHHLKWIQRTWPEAQDFPIKLESYWTGRVAMRDQEFPGMYQHAEGVYGLMHFNAWGNVMAPMMGMALAQALAADRLDQLPFPLVSAQPVANPGKQEFIIRSLMIPAARIAQDFGVI
ncbi:NAD(P)/FAD-dependent oxidoreductase [Sediminihaliea albiluteola]|nr:FAD-dependent oxidoreductase [Sediminihaliea albiluteola]